MGSRGLARRKGVLGLAFVPTLLGDLEFWFDHTLSSYSGGTWEDLSPNGNDATQASAGARPGQTDSGPLVFDGSADYLDLTTPPSLAGGCTFWCVWQMQTRADFTRVMSFGATGETDVVSFFAIQNNTAASNNFQFFGKNDAGNQLSVVFDDTTGVHYAVCSVNAAGSAAEARTLGALQGDTATAGAFGTPDVVRFGAGNNSGGAFSFAEVDIYAAGLYSRALSATERTRLETYLTARFAPDG